MTIETQETIQVGKDDLRIICNAITDIWCREQEAGMNCHLVCIHCGSWINSYHNEPKNIKHENDCPYLVARGISDSCNF